MKEIVIYLEGGGDIRETQAQLRDGMNAFLGPVKGLADPDGLADYYGKYFERGRLPTRDNLEEEPKAVIYRALELATKKTQKGAYGKINHAAALLALVDPAKTRGRCPHCERLFVTLEGKIEGA